ncbi:MAG: hypothetical protein K2M07_00125, partial [Muribaculaceae bacterium]|nr:hypothetical protein [Muribaculaceae bacterium]
MNIRKSLVISSLMLGTALCCVAQDYYDDDIYYNADKARKEQAEKAKKAAEAKRRASQPLPGSDQYTVFTDNNRNVDEYNRRNLTREVVDTTVNEQGDFVYTRRIERFYNPDIVAGSDNDNIKYNYYETIAEEQSADPVNVNIYVNNNPYAWNYGWYYSTWGDPFFYGPGWWGPSWSLTWGPSWAWGPSWSWGWGPSWAWGWGPAWG